MQPTKQEEAPAPKRASTGPAGRPQLGSLAEMPQVRIGAAVVLAIAVGLLIWLLASDHSKAKRAGGTAASVQGLRSLESSVGHPVYWAGPKSGFTYELTRTSDGRIFIRYLPAGVRVGDSRPNYLSVGTYPVKDAVGSVRAIAKRLHTTSVRLTGAGIAVQDTKHPTSVYLAYPGSNYEIEVFDPSPAKARSLALSGQVSAVGSSSRPTRAPAKAATARELRAFAASLGHPVYWAGPQSGTTYERTQTSDGSVYIRYLPPGVGAGDRRRYTTVSTYPIQDPVAAIKTIAKQAGERTFAVAGGGLAAVDSAHPTSVYVAFPGSRYEIEVYDPAAGRARQLVTSGRIVPVH